MAKTSQKKMEKIQAAYQEVDANDKPRYSWEQLSAKFKVSTPTIARCVKGLTGRKSGNKLQAAADVNKALDILNASPEQRLRRAIHTLMETVDDPGLLFLEVNFKTRQCKVGRMTEFAFGG